MIFDYNKLTVLRLKEELKNRGLATTGAKAELVARMMEANPTGEGITPVVDPCVKNPASSDPPDEVRESQDSEIHMAKREAEVSRREKRLMERELELARQGIEMLRQMQNLSVAESSQTRREPETSTGRTAHIKMGIDSIADLLDYFDGSRSAYDRWERQVVLLKSTYELTEGECRVLIAQRLKGRGSEWLHSKPEFLRMTVDQLLTELRTTFRHTPSKAARRRLFDQRIWRKGETFSEYFHEKVIFANRVPIEEDEMVDNIIDGIPDPVLRNQACIQRFETKTSLLTAFGKVSLQQQARTIDEQQEMKRCYRNKRNERSAIKTMPQSGNTKRCHSCGAKDHLIVNCPTKSKGVRCFECRGFGHMSANCPEKGTKEACDVSQMTLSGKYYKETTVNGHITKALVDTGSDLCLMRAGKYIEIGAPQLERKKIMFRGVGSANNETLGEFIAKIEIDRNLYSIRVRVISDTLTQHDLIIGTDFLSTVDVTIREGKISVAKPEGIVEINTQTDVTDISDILPVNYEVNEVDASYIVNREYRTAIENMIQSYVPGKACNTEVKMTIIVKDEEPIYQRARRLSMSEREIVNKQVERVNRTLIPLLSKMAMPKPEEWYRYLDYAQKYLNSTQHRSIGTTPFNLLFGTHMRLKEDVSFREMIEKEWMTIFQEDREELRENAREEISKIQEENRRTYNRKRKKAARYSEYDLVAIQQTQLKPGLKVGEHEGPRETSTAADHMKPWPTNKDDVTSDEEDGDEQYDNPQDGDI